MKLDPQTAAQLASTQQAAQRGGQLAVLHCQLMATFMAPMVAAQFAREAERGEWGDDEIKIDTGPMAMIAGQVASSLMKGHGLK